MFTLRYVTARPHATFLSLCKVHPTSQQKLNITTHNKGDLAFPLAHGLILVPLCSFQLVIQTLTQTQR